MSGHPLGPQAVHLFSWAIKNGSAGVLLEHLFNGGGVTLDLETDGWILIPVEEIERLSKGGEA